MLEVQRLAAEPKMPAGGEAWLPQNFFSIFLPHKLSLNLLGIFVKKWLGCLKLGGNSLKKLQSEWCSCAKVDGGTTRVCSLLNVIKNPIPLSGSFFVYEILGARMRRALRKVLQGRAARVNYYKK